MYTDIEDTMKRVFRQLFPDVADWDDPELADTPKRWIKMMQELTTKQPFNFTTFENPECDEMVVLTDIPFTALCAHHLAPFVGVAHVAYVPDKQIVGLSKIPRLVQNTARGLWTQEDLTQCIANDLQQALDPVGVAVVMRAEHQCMSLRGVKVTGSKTTTSSMKGCFADHSKQARAEFLSLIRSS
jgi:GTP cyclohydrolase I